MTNKNTILIALDVETSGLDPTQDEIVEIAGVRFELAGPVVDSFSSLIRPIAILSDRVQQIHGITNQMLADQPPLAQVMTRFAQWAGPRPTFVAHNAPFDAGFLYQAALQTDLVIEPWRIIDSLEPARDCFPHLPNHRLATLLRSIGFEPSGRLHRALADAEGAAALLNAMVADPTEGDRLQTTRTGRLAHEGHGNENPISPPAQGNPPRQLDLGLDLESHPPTTRSEGARPADRTRHDTPRRHRTLTQDMILGLAVDIKTAAERRQR